MFWAAFTYNSHTILVPLEGDPLAAKGGVSSRIIRAIYQEFLPGIVHPEGEFMQDGAGIHRGSIVKEALAQMGIKLMIWPPFSPDLNPIENLWALLKGEIYRIHPELEHAPDTVATLAALIQAAKEAWERIHIGILYRLATTMEDRVQAVIEAKGWYTKY